MAFEVQDPDSPTTTANAYISVADWKTYCDDRGYDYTTPGLTDQEIQSGITRATDYMDVRWTYEGSKYDCEQSTEVPRGFFYDEDECGIEGFPVRFLHACCEYAKTDLLDGLDLMPNQDNTVTAIRTMLRKKVETLEKEERFSSNNTAYQWPRWALADKMLRQSGLVGTASRTLGRG